MGFHELVEEVLSHGTVSIVTHRDALLVDSRDDLWDPRLAGAFTRVLHPDALVVYPKSRRARKNDIPAVRARPTRPRESLLPGPPKSPAAANVKCVADSSFQRGREVSNGFFWTAPFWNRTHPADTAMRRERARTATALRRKVADPCRFLGIRRGSLMSLPAIDACFGVRSTCPPSRAFIHVNAFLSSSNSSLSESGLTRTAHGRASTLSPEVPSAPNFRVARAKALALPRKSTRPARGPSYVAAIPFMRSGLVRDRSYQGLVAN